MEMQKKDKEWYNRLAGIFFVVSTIISVFTLTTAVYLLGDYIIGLTISVIIVFTNLIGFCFIIHYIFKSVSEKQAIYTKKGVLSVRKLIFYGAVMNLIIFYFALLAFIKFIYTQDFYPMTNAISFLRSSNIGFISISLILWIIGIVLSFVARFIYSDYP